MLVGIFENTKKIQLNYCITHIPKILNITYIPNILNIPNIPKILKTG